MFSFFQPTCDKAMIATLGGKLTVAPRSRMYLFPYPRRRVVEEVTGLELSGVVDEALLARLLHLKYLKSLILSTAQVPDTALALVPHFKWLTYLNLDDTGVTDRGLRLLAKCGTLQSLSLAGTKVSDLGVAKWIPHSVRRLALDRCGIGNAAIADAVPNTLLDVLGLSHTRLSDEGCAALRVFPRLTALYIGHTAVSDRGVRVIAETLPGLSVLAVNDTMVGAGTGEAIGLLPCLSVFLGAGTALDRFAVEQLFAASSIRTVDLSRTYVIDEWLESLSSGTQVSEIRLDDTLIGDDGAAQVGEIESVCRLRLRRTAVTDRGVEQLSKLPELTELYLDGTGVSDRSIAILSHSSLSILSLEGTRVSDNGIATLDGTGRLSWINLRNTNVTMEGVQALKKRVPHMGVMS